MAHILAGLDPEEYDRIYSDGQLLRRIGIYFKPHTFLMVTGVGVILLNAGLGVLVPVLIARGIDALGSNRDTAYIALLMGAILLTGIFVWGGSALQKWQSTLLVGDIIQQIRQDAFNSVMAHDMSFFDARSTGEVVSRIASDASAFGTAITMTLNVMGQFLLIAALTIVLFVINVELALITVVFGVLIIVITLGFRRLARQLTRLQQRSHARLNVVIEETISGITVAKNFRQERSIYDDLTHSNRQWYAATLRMNTVLTSIFPFLQVCTGLATVAIVFFGGEALQSGHLSTGQWYLFLQSVLLFWTPLTSVASFWSQFQQGLTSGERVFALIDVESHVVQTDRRPVPSVAGQIEFRDVTFQYTDREVVLENFSLTIAPGETVALVGHTGAGKTSITRLIARFYEFQKGTILIDGRDIRTLNLEDYRKHIGIVPQMPFLFSGTVADNIRYARPDASNEEVIAAARLIAHGDWLSQLPQGLDTPISERGRSLSAGQRQLVALSRIVLQNPSIVILDEATASIDPLTEAQIQEGLDTLFHERTAIMIAHRLPTVRKADRIIVLKHGSIIEQGTHRELLSNGGHYSELYRLYFQHQFPDYEISDALP
jgi:ABC-type multidrug transport system fused ATPase/permease subunit